MARPKEPDMPADIPGWLMTFSDVITLLMTFFILLLTFATTDPQTFDRIQVAIFRGAGATGVAGPRQKPSEKDSLLMRERARSGRITTRGSEMPPITRDPSYEALDKGFKSLQEEEKRNLATEHAATIPLSLLISKDEKMTSIGQRHLKKLASQMRGREFDLKLHVSSEDELPRAFKLAWYLVERHKIPTTKIAVGLTEFGEVAQPMLEMSLYLQL